MLIYDGDNEEFIEFIQKINECSDDFNNPQIRPALKKLFWDTYALILTNIIELELKATGEDSLWHERNTPQLLQELDHVITCG